jgi:hypothetical protein
MKASGLDVHSRTQRKRGHAQPFPGFLEGGTMTSGTGSAFEAVARYAGHAPD